jgi:hypothetical protein
METINISRDELKKLISETLVDILINRKDLIEDAVREALEILDLVSLLKKDGKVTI